ncbi:YciI family protein [Terrisporobacter sp.]
MKYFFIEGTLKQSLPVPENIMQAHIAYSKKAMDNNLILMTATKTNQSGALFIMKAKSLKEIDDYLSNEPLKLNNIQNYKITQFKPSYFNKSLDKWFAE